MRPMQVLLLLTLTPVLVSQPTRADEPIRVMSFNIRYGKANDGENRWEKRDWLVAKTIKNFDPDLLGTQETLKFQADYLHRELKGYTYFGRSRMKTPNEHCGIFFRTKRFTQLAGGHFWLSTSPEVPESKSWDSSLPRMATWVLLNDKSAEDAPPVLFLNTHFDHRGTKARTESAGLIRQRLGSLRAIAQAATVIVTGDFNTPEGSEPYKALLEAHDTLRDTFRVAHPRQQTNEGTFGAFSGRTAGGRIDWVLADKTLFIKSASIDRTAENGRYPSDHYPVTAVLERR